MVDIFYETTTPRVKDSSQEVWELLPAAQDTKRHSLGVTIFSILPIFESPEFYELNVGMIPDLVEFAKAITIHDAGKNHKDFAPLLNGEIPADLMACKKVHVVEGRKMLEEAGFSEIYKVIAGSHHDYANSEGYIAEERDRTSIFYPWSRLISLRDCYDAIRCPNRKYNNVPKNHSQAMAILRAGFEGPEPKFKQDLLPLLDHFNVWYLKHFSNETTVEEICSKFQLDFSKFTGMNLVY